MSALSETIRLLDNRDAGALDAFLLTRPDTTMFLRGNARLAARARGVSSSILFTEQSNFAAQACYAQLGYQIVGDYILVEFASVQNPPLGC